MTHDTTNCHFTPPMIICQTSVRRADSLEWLLKMPIFRLSLKSEICIKSYIWLNWATSEHMLSPFPWTHSQPSLMKQKNLFDSYISHKYIAISHLMHNILEVYLAGKLLLFNNLRITCSLHFHGYTPNFLWWNRKNIWLLHLPQIYCHLSLDAQYSGSLSFWETFAFQ